MFPLPFLFIVRYDDDNGQNGSKRCPDIQTLGKLKVIFVCKTLGEENRGDSLRLHHLVEAADLRTARLGERILLC